MVLTCNAARPGEMGERGEEVNMRQYMQACTIREIAPRSYISKRMGLVAYGIVAELRLKMCVSSVVVLAGGVKCHQRRVLAGVEFRMQLSRVTNSCAVKDETRTMLDADVEKASEPDEQSR